MSSLKEYHKIKVNGALVGLTKDFDEELKIEDAVKKTLEVLDIEGVEVALHDLDDSILK